MNFSIDNYSVLNNYDYTGKSPVISLLDNLSAPCRKVLGGRKVYVQKLTWYHPMSTAGKVCTVFALFIVGYIYLPLAIIPVASLLLKMATLPWFWEKKKVIAQVQGARIQKQAAQEATQQKVDEFNKAFRSNDWRTAIQVYMQHPNIAQCAGIYSDYFKAINCHINNNAPWNELEGPLSRLTSADAYKLINLAIYERLNREFSKIDQPITTPDEIITFIQRSLPHQDIDTLENCYIYILSNTLQVDMDHKPLLNLNRMDIADRMITHLIQVKLAQTQNELDRTLIQLNAPNQLRPLIFKKGQSHQCFSTLFNSPNHMQRVSVIIQNIRSINKLNHSIKQYNVVLQANNWHKILKEEISWFTHNFGQLNFNENERQIVREIQDNFENMFQLITSIMGKAITEGFTAQHEQICRNVTSITQRLEVHQPSSNPSMTELLELVRQASLKNLTDNMMAFLLNKINEAMKTLPKAA